MKKFSKKQSLFVSEYLVDLNATQAAIRAGYSPKTANEIGSENLAKPYIAEAISKAMDERSKRTEITADYVLNIIRETVERCRQTEPVLDKLGKPVFIKNPDGVSTAAYMFDSKGVLRGCELLGKHLKLFTDKVEMSTDGLAEALKRARERVLK